MIKIQLNRQIADTQQIKYKIIIVFLCTQRFDWKINGNFFFLINLKIKQEFIVVKL